MNGRASSVEDLSLGRAFAAALSSGHEPDAALPVLERLLDRDSARRWCRRHLAGLDLDARSLQRIDVLRYRPGRRCALRLVFRGTRDRCLYLKACKKRRARRIADTLDRLHEPGLPPDVRLPRLLRLVARHSVIVLSEVGGASLEPRLARGDVDVVAAGLGRSLARFHALPVEGLPEWTVDDELELVDRRADVLRERAAGLRDVDALLGAAREASTALGAAAVGTVHRDLHPQQVLLDEDAIGLVDLDDAAKAPTEIDLGNLLAHFDLIGLHVFSMTDAFAKAERELLAAHGAVRPSCADALGAARALSLIRLAGIQATRIELGDLWLRLLDRARTVLEPRP